MSDFSSKLLFNLNVLTPKPGRLDDFIRAQLDGVPRLGDVRGLIESRLYRAEDGSNAVIVSGFESLDAFQAFQQSTAFQAERARLQPLVESVRPAFYRLVHEREPLRADA